LASATGVAVVIWRDPAHESYPLGVKRQRMVPSAASMAIVFP